MGWCWARDIHAMLGPELEPGPARPTGKLKVFGETLKPCPKAGLLRGLSREKQRCARVQTESCVVSKSLVTQFPVSGCLIACCSPTMTQSSPRRFLFLEGKQPLTRRMSQMTRGASLQNQEQSLSGKICSFQVEQDESAVKTGYGIYDMKGKAHLCNDPSRHKCPVGVQGEEERREGYQGPVESQALC